MELSENSIRAMDNYDDPAVEGASRGGDGASTLGGDLDAAMGLRLPGSGVSQMEMQQMMDENSLLRKRLQRRNLLLDAVRKAYIRDVVVVKAELAKSSQKNYHLNENVAKALPSLDLRPWLKLFAPDECTFSVGGANERNGGHIEIIHRESQKVNQLTAKCEELREIEQEQRIKASVMEAQAQKDRSTLEDQMQKSAEDRRILCAQIEAQKVRLAKFDERAIDRLTQQVANLQAKLSAASRSNESHKSDHSKLAKVDNVRKALQEEVEIKERQLKELTQMQREVTTKLEAMTTRAEELDSRVQHLEQTGRDLQERYDRSEKDLRHSLEKASRMQHLLDESRESEVGYKQRIQELEIDFKESMQREEEAMEAMEDKYEKTREALREAGSKVKALEKTVGEATRGSAELVRKATLAEQQKAKIELKQLTRDHEKALKASNDARDSSNLKVTMLQQKLVEAGAEIAKLKKGVMVTQASQQVTATQEMAAAMFDKLDVNKDGVLTKEEFTEATGEVVGAVAKLAPAPADGEGVAPAAASVEGAAADSVPASTAPAAAAAAPITVPTAAQAPMPVPGPAAAPAPAPAATAAPAATSSAVDHDAKKRIHELERQVGKLSVEIAEHKETEDRLKEQLQKFKHKNQGSMLKGAMLKMKIPKLPIGPAKTESNEDALTQQIETLEAAVKELEGTVEDLQSSLEIEETEKARLEDALAKMRGKMEKLDDEKDGLEERLDDLKADTAAQLALHKGEAQKEVEAAKEQLKEMKSKLSDEKKEAGKLSKQLQASKKEVTKLQNKVDMNSDVVQDLQVKLDLALAASGNAMSAMNEAQQEQAKQRAQAEAERRAREKADRDKADAERDAILNEPIKSRAELDAEADAGSYDPELQENFIALAASACQWLQSLKALRCNEDPTEMTDEDLVSFSTGFDPEAATNDEVAAALEEGKSELLVQLLEHVMDDACKEVETELSDCRDQIDDMPDGITSKDISDLKQAVSHFEALSNRQAADAAETKKETKAQLKEYKEHIRELEYTHEDDTHQIATLKNLLNASDMLKAQHQDLRDLHELLVSKHDELEKAHAALEEREHELEDELHEAIDQKHMAEKHASDVEYQRDSIEKMNAKLTEKLCDTEMELDKWVSAHRERMETNTEVAIQACPGVREIAVQTEFKTPDMTLKQSNSIDRYPATRVRHPIVTAAGLMRPSTAMGGGRDRDMYEMEPVPRRPSTVLSPIGRRGSDGSLGSERLLPRSTYIENLQRHAWNG